MQARIHRLDEATINQIAAGEVVERPAAVVKELVENAIDARAGVITVEIKDGGTSLIRVTDNGSGITADQVEEAFVRHATSKITDASDLNGIESLGFRGEALSSITAVGMVEVVTKTRDALTGIRLCIDGGVKKSLEEIGCPEGTTVIVRNLFYNTPARKKFLKSDTAEGNTIAELMERLAQSHPEIAFKFVNNNQVKLHTTGNGDLQSVIYQIYGRETAKNLVETSYEEDGILIRGLIGKPVVSRGNRSNENYFINGRYVRSPIIMKAIEEAYKPYLMSHRYPMTSLQMTIDPTRVDVNVHPTKMEVRFKDGDRIWNAVFRAVTGALAGRNMTVEVESSSKEERKKERKEAEEAAKHAPEPFEKRRLSEEVPLKAVRPVSQLPGRNLAFDIDTLPQVLKEPPLYHVDRGANQLKPVAEPAARAEESGKPVQLELPFEEPGNLMAEQDASRYRIIGQVFETYWLIEYGKELFYIDQHAAHEKVLYEQAMAHYREKEFAQQMLLPPVILTLSAREEAALQSQMELLTEIGFEIEHFGGKEYQVRAVPADLYNLNKEELLMEYLDSAEEAGGRTPTPEMILSRLATMSCKAAVKGGDTLTEAEARRLIEQLMKLEDPYHCPHGRPVIISVSKHELEKRFKRIV
ncbi:MAG: DNA mismatch repair endonuclease MutL [Lachnospiraceae bacterium]|nr:DNA mismatch repair endonuclease MutL [Lachnospiraceae bacterium]